MIDSNLPIDEGILPEETTLPIVDSRSVPVQTVTVSPNGVKVGIEHAEPSKNAHGNLQMVQVYYLAVRARILGTMPPEEVKALEELQRAAEGKNLAEKPRELQQFDEQVLGVLRQLLSNLKARTGSILGDQAAFTAELEQHLSGSPRRHAV